MQDPNRPVTGYPVPNPNGCAPPSSAAAAATAYPYQNPYSYPHVYVQQPPPYQNPRATLFRRLLLCVIAFAAILATISLITWLVLRPRYPDFTIQSLSLSNYNSSSENLNATWNALILVSNSNKKLSVFYEGIESVIDYGVYDLANSRIPPFSQGKRNQTTVEVNFAMVNSYVDSKVVNGINQDRSSGQVRFTVKIGAWISFRYGGWRLRRRDLGVSCRDVAVSGSTGKMMDGAKKCSVF